MENAIAINQERLWDWKLFCLILTYSILPTIYSSYSLYLIGNVLPSAAGLAVAAQWQFVQIVLEVVQEATVLPIFFFVGSKIRANQEQILYRLKTSLVTIFLLSLLLISLVLVNLERFVVFIGTDPSINTSTSTYLSVKIWASLFSILNIGLVIAIESLNKKMLLFYLILLKTIGIIILDSLFFGGYAYSLDWGILGAAYSNLIMEGLIFIATLIILLRSYNSSFTQFLKMPWLIDFRLFRNIGLGSGLESLVKNLAYFALIIKLLNELGPDEISGYYLSMHLFWSFLLVPVLAAAETTRALISNHITNASAIKQVLKRALFTGGIIVVVWICLIPFWDNMLLLFNQDDDIIYHANMSMSYLLIPYILLAFNFLLDSLFYGLGKTQYLVYQALITNGTVYLMAYILYWNGFWRPTYVSILFLFGIGIVIDSLITVYFVRRVLVDKSNFPSG